MPNNGKLQIPCPHAATDCSLQTRPIFRPIPGNLLLLALALLDGQGRGC